MKAPIHLPSPRVRDLETLNTLARTLDGKLSLERAAATLLGQDLRGDWKEFDEFNPRNATSAYVELEWE